MTPIELHAISERSTAVLQAMRDAAAASDGLEVPEYDGPCPDEYRRIFDEWLADLQAPPMPSMAGIGWGR